MCLQLSSTNVALLVIGMALAILNANGDRMSAFIAGLFARARRASAANV